MHVSVSSTICLWAICLWACGGQMRTSDPLELELQLWATMLALGIEPRNSTRTSRAFDCWAISPSLTSAWVSKSLRTRWPRPHHRPGDSRASSGCPTPQTVLSHPKQVAVKLLLFCLPKQSCSVVDQTWDLQPYNCVCPAIWCRFFCLLYILIYNAPVFLLPVFVFLLLSFALSCSLSSSSFSPLIYSTCEARQVFFLA